MYKNPMDYTKEDISEIMHKPIKISLGEWESSEVKEEVIGEITFCNLAANPPFLPTSFHIQTQTGERVIRVDKIKKIEDLK